MRTVLHGGAPLYLGQLINTTLQLLTNIKDTLVTAGWTITVDQIAASNRFVARGVTSNNHNCWFEFTVSNRGGVLDGKSLNIRGDLTGAGTTLSPNELQLNFIENADNRLWLVADSDSGAIALSSFEGGMVGVHFGFVDRLELTDEFAWYVGYLNNHFGNVFVAKSAHNNTNWRRLSDDYLNSSTVNGTLSAPMQGILDTTVIANSYSNYDYVTIQNSAYLAYKGALNAYDNKPEISERYLIEGRGAITNYASPGNSMPAQLYNRGNLKHVANGFAFLPAAAQVSDKYGGRYLSTGGEGWQGITLIEPTPLTATLSPVFVNGGSSSNYAGALFNSTGDILNAIKTNLQTANWVVHSDQIVSNLKLIMKGASNGANCWIEFRVVTNGAAANGKFLRVRGDLTGAGAQLSADTLQLSFIEGADNWLWLTADDEAGAITVRSFDGSMSGIHFGFLDRYNNTDSFAWMVGAIDNSLATAYVAKSAHNNTVWRQVSADFSTYSSLFTNESSAPTEGVFDRYTIAAKTYGGYTFPGGTNFNNAGRYAYNGALNGLNQKPIIGAYYYREGGITASSGAAIPTYRRGSVKFACVGLCSLLGGSTVTGDGGKVYMSVGGVGWQGMRIN